MRLPSSTRISSLAAGARISSWRDSWVMFFHECARFVLPMIAMRGTPALRDSTSPVARFVAPGPRVASQTPGRPVIRAKASAANAPHRSSLISVWLSPSSRTAS